MRHHHSNPEKGQLDLIKSVTLTIDGQQVTVPEGTRILEAARKVNVHIPTLCEHPDLCKRAVCRICVVECDGRGKLAAACAQDVWEGVSVVTNNRRIQSIRKTIVELLLADHPQDCLSCIRSKKCELQSLAESLGIRTSSFERVSAVSQPPEIESETLVRSMDKCVKCGRCVEVCQEIQTIRAINTSHRSKDYEIVTPYRQALGEGPCTFCGRCAAVCPVGAIYEHDQTADVWASLNNSGRHTIAQISPVFADAVNKELGFPAGTITIGKILTAIMRLGFDGVFDANAAANESNSEWNDELQQRIKSGGKLQSKLPMVTGCSAGAANFVKYFYPDLAGCLSAGKNPRQIFADSTKAEYALNEGLDLSNVTSVSFTTSVAQKYTAGSQDKTDFALTARELVRMIKLAGIDIETLPEEHFDFVSIDSQAPVKRETIYGFAHARKVMEAIRKGECKAQWIEIII